MREWKGLEVVETIYEEHEEEEEEEEDDDDDEVDGTKTLSLSPSPATTTTPPPSCTPPPLPLLPPPPLESIVQAWSRATGCKTDVIVRVQDRCFHLHKDLLASRSRYLRRKLTETSDVTVTLPEGLSPETFADAARFCYGADVALTPANLAAMWVAAEWLEMASDGGEEGMVQRTEDYFRQEVAGDPVSAAAVLRGCVGMLGGAAAEAAAGLAVRCVEVVASEEDGGDERWIQDLAGLSAEEFRVVAEAMREWFVHDHDLLYRIVDYYLKNQSGSKLTEENKTRICYTINCTRLSHHLLVHLVQNPRLPLRFVVQAMLVEQLSTRHSVLDLPAVPQPKLPPPLPSAASEDNLTLGAILQRDAALRQVAHLRATMEATTSRIESLERDLAGLRRRLRWSEDKKADMESARSASFHFGLRGVPKQRQAAAAEGVSSCNGNSSRNGRGLGRKLVSGLKSMFRTSSSTTAGKDGGDGEELAVVQVGRTGHRRNRSFA